MNKQGHHIDLDDLFCLSLGIIVLILVSILPTRPNNETLEELDEDITMIYNVPYFYNSDTINKEMVYEALLFYDVKHPEIVLAQSILETGHYKSDVFIYNNNLFGLYNSRTKEYYRFEHWTESIEAYIRWIESKYKPKSNKPHDGDYYEFLIKLGYAEDPNYVRKLKRIIKTFEL